MSVYRRGQRALNTALESATTPDQKKAIRKRLAGRPWTVEVELGKVRYTLSSGTPRKREAIPMEATLNALHTGHNQELLTYLRNGRLSLPAVHAASKRKKGLDDLLTACKSEDADIERPKLGALVEEWYQWLQTCPYSDRSKRDLAASTAARYEVSMERLLEYVGLKLVNAAGASSTVPDKETIKRAWAPLSPDVFTRDLLVAYRKARKTAGRSAGTINRDMNTLLAFYTWLENSKKIHLVRPKVPREKEPKGRERVLSPGEWHAVHAAFVALNGGVAQFRGRRSGGTQSDGFVPMAQLWMLFEVLVLTGLRLGEALSLQWGDLDKTRGIIHISRSLEWSGKDSTSSQDDKAAMPVKVGRLKSLGSERDVPLSAQLMERLEAHKTVFAQFGTGRRSPIFPAQVFNLRRMQALWNRALVAADLNHARVHDLRHTFASTALKKKTAINTLQGILGHCDAHMVMRYVRGQNNEDTTLAGNSVAAAILGESTS
jgi:integrase